MKIKKAMVCDDSATSRMIIKQCIEIAGLHEIDYVEVNDGEEALRTLEKVTVDIIFTDLVMPNMRGEELIEKIKNMSSFKDIPIVVISSLGTERKMKELMDKGAAAVIKKPISPTKVLDALDSLALTDGLWGI